MYDYVIVGAGLYGAVFANEMKTLGKSVLVLEQRDHIGGNVYTRDIDGINVHMYGPHIFHTNSFKIWNYINQFAEFNQFTYRPRVKYKDRIFSFPINLMTLYQLWNVTTPIEAKKILQQKVIQNDDPKNLEEWILSQVGEELYRIFIYGYTKKQWLREPKNLPSFIVKRLPIRLTYDDNYFEDRYQGIPVGGYTQIFEKMLDGVEVKLNTPLEKDWHKYGRKLVYSGRIDEFFDFKLGELEYRTLDFEHKIYEGDFQGVAVINYTEESIPYTRIIEHKHFEFKKQNKTVVTYEYPKPWAKNKVPYYPINDEKNNSLYEKYKELGKRLSNVIFGGRLGNYRYYDMHQVIASSLEQVKKELF